MPSVGEDVERLEPSYTAGGNVKWCRHFENSLAIPQLIKYQVTMWPSNSTPKYIPKRNLKTCPCKNLCMDVHSSIIHKSPKAETSKCLSVDEKINKMWFIHKNGILSSHKKEWNTDTCYNMDEPWKHAKWEKTTYLSGWRANNYVNSMEVLLT